MLIVGIVLPVFFTFFVFYFYYVLFWFLVSPYTMCFVYIVLVHSVTDTDPPASGLTSGRGRKRKKASVDAIGYYYLPYELASTE